jgi:hypothetical protein
MNKIGIIITSIFFIVSCAKQEGEGGIASIEGIMMVQKVNSMLKPVGKPYRAKDKVYISYGTGTLQSDDANTSPEGKYVFNFLVPGNYSIFAYSDDTAKFNAIEKIVIRKPVTIDTRKQKVTVDTLTIYKYVDFDDGSAQISGVVKQIEYYSGTTIPKDTISAQNADVFLTYGDNAEILDRIRSSYNGSFIFSNLIEGTYTIFVYSEQPYSKENLIVSKTVSISSDNQKVQLAPMYVSNF